MPASSNLADLACAENEANTFVKQLLSTSITLSQNCGRTTPLPDWELFFDAANRTRPEDLEETWRKDATPVHIPHVWEQIRPGHNGVGWYRQTLQVDKISAAVVWRVRFSAVHYRADVYLNGIFLTRHDGGYTPFVVDITEHLRVGKNELLVRVVDPPREYPVEGLQSSHPLRQTALPTYKAGWYYSFGGLWQPVHLLKTPAIWLEDAFIKPSLDPRAIHVDWTLGGTALPQNGDTLAYEVRSTRDGTVFASDSIAVSQQKGEFTASLSDAPLWSCEDPHLLELVATLRTSAGTDTRTWCFGLREFTTDGKRFLLNGSPIHLRGVLHQGAFPRTLVFPHDKDMALKDIRRIKEAGCNLSRITLRPASPTELDLCDEMGLLVISEPPIGWVAWDEQIDTRCLQEVEEMIRRDRNRPSVVMWTLLNEFSDTVYYRTKSPAPLIRAACDLGSRLDPTRLMSGNSGRGGGDDVPNGIFGQGRPPVPILDEHIYLRNFPKRQDVERRILNAGKNTNELLFVSEFGTSGFPDMDRVLSKFTPKEQALGLEDYQQMKNYRDAIVAGWKELGLEKHFPTLAEFYHALAYDQTEMVRLEQRALRQNPRVAGYVITQGADAASEFGGIVDLWREPKPVYTVYRDLNRDQILLFDIPGICFETNQPLTARVVASDLTDSHEEWRVHVTLRHEGHEHQTWTLTGRPGWSTELGTLSITPNTPGEWTLHGKVSTSAGSIIEDKVTFDALSLPDFSRHPILLMDSTCSSYGSAISPLGKQLETLGLPITKYANQANDPTRPIVVHLKGRDNALNYFEKQRVLRKEVEEGRFAIFVDCDLAYLHYFFEDQTPIEIYGNGAYAGNMGFALDRNLIPRVGPEGQIGPAYGGCYPRIFPDAFHAHRQGAEILALHAIPYQFGRPDSIEWGASLLTKRIGKGRIWICAFPLFSAIESGDPAAREMFERLLAAAKAPL
ncbi:MAG: glycoside hydrolase family 2 protein [Chthoniobacterales bacterium]